MIELLNITKSFHRGFIPKKVYALRNLDLHVKAGEIFSYLGPNGAGKTTTIKILMHLISPDSGEARIMGEDVSSARARRSVGFLPDHPYFYDYLRGEELLSYCGRLSGMTRTELKKRIPELLKFVELKGAGSMQLRKYSRGMLQRIGLAQALLHNPQLLILDEPLTGLDPVGRRTFREIFLRLRDEGKTIFFSSHILSDAEVLCDRVGILVEGVLREVGILEEIIQQKIQWMEIHARINDQKITKEILEHLPMGTVKGNSLSVRLESEKDIYPTLYKMKNLGLSVISVIPHGESLEDIFIKEVAQKNK